MTSRKARGRIEISITGLGTVAVFLGRRGRDEDTRRESMTKGLFPGKVSQGYNGR